MSGFPGSPRILKGGFVLLDPVSFAVVPGGIIVLQYNPDTLSRTLKIKGAEEGGDRSEALRLTGPAVETIKLDVEIDATDQLENPTQNPATVQYGVSPQLAVLETLVYPTSAALQNNYSLSQQGTLEIMPMMKPLPLFVWSAAAHPTGADYRTQRDRGGLRPEAQPLAGQGEPGHARSLDRRPVLQRQGRKPIHGLPAAEGDPGRAQSARVLRHFRPDRRAMTTDPTTDPVQAMLAQTSLQRSLFQANSRYYGLATSDLRDP